MPTRQENWTAARTHREAVRLTPARYGTFFERLDCRRIDEDDVDGAKLSGVCVTGGNRECDFNAEFKKANMSVWKFAIIRMAEDFSTCVRLFNPEKVSLSVAFLNESASFVFHGYPPRTARRISRSA